MQKIKTLLAILMIYTLLCGPSMIVFAQDPTPTPEPAEVTDEEKPAEEEKKPDAEPSARRPADQITFIGLGYDITGRYAHRDSTRGPIFSLGEKELKPIPNSGSTYEENSGKTFSEYQTNFANKLSIAGSYRIFSGSLSLNFAMSEGSSSSKEYTTIMNVVVKQRYEMSINEEAYVLPEARTAIDGMDPEKLFKTYGTHYIWQADLGGRVDYNIVFNKSATQKEKEIQVAAKAAIDTIVGPKVSIENETSFRNSMKKLDEAGKVKIVVSGGSEDASARVRANQLAIADWAKSVGDRSDLQLAGFTDRSLKPIWDLASTPERRQQLEQAFVAWLNKSEIKEAPGSIVVNKAVASEQVASNWNGQGTNGDERHRFAAYSPVADTENGYYVVGHTASRDARLRKIGTIRTILVKEVGGLGKLLAAPLDFTEVTHFSGNRRNTEEWSIWRASCPVGFVALGDFAKWKKDKPSDMPNQNPFKDVRCVKEGLTEAAAPLSKNEIVYDNEGSGEWNFVAYKIKPAAGSTALDGGFFYGVKVENFNDEPPADTAVRVLKNPAGAGMSFLIREGGEDNILNAFQGSLSPLAGFEANDFAVQIATSRFRLSDIRG